MIWLIGRVPDVRSLEEEGSVSVSYRLAGWLLAFAVLLPLLVPAPATAANTYYSVSITYDKNGCVANCGTTPKLIYKYGYINDWGNWVCCYTTTKTAGSGNSSGDNKNPCAVSVGWIPDTYAPSPDNLYSVTHTEANGGNDVKGTAWLIRNRLYGGSKTTAPSRANCDLDSAYERTDLLIHSEMTDSHTQTCGSPYEEKWCWDGTSDYYSLGCIKVSWGQIHNNSGQTYGALYSLDWYWHNRGGTNGEDLYVVP